MSEHDEVTALKKALQVEKSTTRRQQLLKQLWNLRRSSEGDLGPTFPASLDENGHADVEPSTPPNSGKHVLASG